MTFTRPLAFVGVFTGLLVTPSRLSAQGGSVSAVSVKADHELLGARLTGPSGRFTLPLLSSRLSLRFGAERLSGEAGRSGIPCAGLIPPGICQTPEPLRDNAHLTSASAGLGVRAFDRRGVAVSIVSDVRLAWVQVDTRSETSDRRLSGSKTLQGIEYGLEGVWTPIPAIPVSVGAGLMLGRLMPLASSQVADGYTPFEESFSLTRVRVGIGWRAW